MQHIRHEGLLRVPVGGLLTEASQVTSSSGLVDQEDFGVELNAIWVIGRRIPKESSSMVEINSLTLHTS